MKQISFILFVAITVLGASCNSAKSATQETMPPPTSERSERGEREGPPNVDQLFSRMDANNDDQLSKAEVKGPLLEQFDTVDTNNDGMLSKEEVEKAPKSPRGGGRSQRG